MRTAIPWKQDGSPCSWSPLASILHPEHSRDTSISSPCASLWEPAALLWGKVLVIVARGEGNVRERRRTAGLEGAREAPGEVLAAPPRNHLAGPEFQKHCLP